MTLNDAELDLFEQLTSRTFYVVDTEYTGGPDKDGNHLISIAIVPIVGGVRQKPALYKEMNPSVPITASSRAVHGFTDAKVAGKRPFAYYARAIVEALADPDAVFVSHTAVDIKLLRDELTRLDEARTEEQKAGWASLASLPELPVIDTSSLPRLVGLEGVGHRGSIGLADLCALTKVSNTKPHDARGDAKAAADALIAMLTHVARTAKFWSLDDLLKAHDRGTTRAPRGPQYIRSSKTQDPPLDPAHVARHTQPRDHPGTPAELDELLELSAECIQLRCQWLRDEMREAAPYNASKLIDRLMRLLPSAQQPGEAGTLLGAVTELLASEPAPGADPAMKHTRALRWWAKRKGPIRDSVPCADRSAESCPSCRAGEGCPRDVIYQQIAEIATLGANGVLDRRRIKNALLPDGSVVGRRALSDWEKPHPEATAWMLWRVVSFEQNEGLAVAAQHLQLALDKGLHVIEPRLALLACQMLLPGGEAERATAIAEEALAEPSTDTVYAELATWLMWAQHSQALAARKREPAKPKAERLSRPLGRVNSNPYAID